MPVKIKNILDNKVRIISLKESKDLEKYPSNIWKVVARKDIVEVMEPNILMYSGYINHGDFEKEDLQEVLTAHPQATYRLLPDWDDWNKIKVTENNQDSDMSVFDLEPITTPTTIPTNRTITLHTIISRAGTWVVRIFKKISSSVLYIMLTFIGTVAATLFCIAIVNYIHGKGFTL